MTIDWSFVFGAIAVISTLLNGFVLLRINPLINALELLKQEVSSHGKRLDSLEAASNKSQENNVKLAVIEERQKTADVKMDRIEKKVDTLIERPVIS